MCLYCLPVKKNIDLRCILCSGVIHHNKYAAWSNGLTRETIEVHSLSLPLIVAIFCSLQVSSKSTLWFLNLGLMVPTENPK